MINRQSLENLYAKYPRTTNFCVVFITKFIVFITVSGCDRKNISSFFVQQKFIYQVRFLFWFIIHRLRIHSYYDINFRPFTSISNNISVATALLNVLNNKKPKQLIHKIAIADLESLVTNNNQNLKTLTASHLKNKQTSTTLATSHRADSSAQSSTHTKQYDTTKLDNALQEIITILRNNKVDYFLMSGTLLGLIRNNKPLKNDDIDIGLYASKTEFNSVVSLLTEHQLQVEDMQSPYLIKLLIHDVSIDLFFHFEESESLWHGSLYHRWYNKNIEHDTITYQGKNYTIPKDYDVYLTENYGDWKNPVSNFSIYLDCPNYAPQINNDALVFLFKNLLQVENNIKNNNSLNINKQYAKNLCNQCQTILASL